MYRNRAPLWPLVSVRLLAAILASNLASTAFNATADDWPMWRHDPARSATSSQSLSTDLHLLWIRQLPQPKPAYREPRIQFDAGYEPVVLGKTMFIASSGDDSVAAFDTETGRLKWRFYAEGPVRLAPVAWKDRLFFGSDDGRLYCVATADGGLRWKFQAVPSSRKVLGNGRLISVWPIRGGPVVHEGRVYFAAGAWPFEGVFLYSLDAESGRVVWRNDESGYLYGQHPHAAEALGGVTLQGYLVVCGDELLVPCGQAVPARFDLATGKLRSFELPKAGRLPGGWFVSADVRRGQVVQDAAVNRDLHEDKVYQGPGIENVRTTIRVGERTFRFEDGFPGVDGEIHTMLAADGKLFVVTAGGTIHAFASEQPPSVTRCPLESNAPVPDASDTPEWIPQAIGSTEQRHGYALVLGIDDASVLDALLAETQFHIIGIDPDAGMIDRLRRRYAAAGLYGNRIALHAAEPNQIDLPPYIASLAVITGANWIESKSEASLLEILRPYGGTACLRVSQEQHASLESGGAFPHGFTVNREGELTIVRREGSLPAAANYTGTWRSDEQRVKFPVGLLWFDDSVSHFKRSPQPMLVDGLMISNSKDWMARHREGRKVPYDLLPPVLSDVYTGRVLSAEEQAKQLPHLPTRDITAAQPNQYRPPSQTDDWNPKKPVPGQRVNPLTGETEPRTFPKSYGCDGGVDYGTLFTMRSGTAAFYDKRLESGTCYISGTRSGCTNSIIPACGLLNVPYFFEGCTCSYQLPCGLALVSMPPEYEQWAAWGEGKAENIRQVGINLGAPGDRMTEAGTLWLDHPSRGGPSPEVRVDVEPATATYYYRHSLWIDGGSGWPWVAASGVEGATSVKLFGLRKTNCTVRLVFAEPEHEKPGRRVFDVLVNGRTAVRDCDVVKATGAPMRAATFEFADVPVDGTLEIGLVPRVGETILSGIEVVSP